MPASVSQLLTMLRLEMHPLAYEITRKKIIARAHVTVRGRASSNGVTSTCRIRVSTVTQERCSWSWKLIRVSQSGCCEVRSLKPSSEGRLRVSHRLLDLEQSSEVVRFSARL